MTVGRWLILLLLSLGAALACGPEPRPRAPLSVAPAPLTPPQQAELWRDVRGILETRCVVCHGCYDAPCQLKLGSFDGIARGASRRVVYDGARLLATEPTRLGSVGHQVSTRLYMDFLRMESEAMFLQLLPPARRPQLIDYWYRGVTGDAKKVVDKTLQGANLMPAVRYASGEPEKELLALIEKRLAPVRARDYDLERAAPGDLSALQELDAVWGESVTQLPELSFVTVTDGANEPAHYTVLRDSAHTNVAHLFNEESRRVSAEDELTVANGFLGAYPNALFELPRGELPAFVQAIRQRKGAGDYAALRQRYGVLRTSPQFWEHSDALQRARERRGGESIGLLDYNRLGGW